VNEINCIGVLAHPLRPQTFPVAQHIHQTIRQRGLESWVHTEWEEADVQADVAAVDMVVAIGGDGAMLRAARVCAAYEVPVLGVNMGQLGFLTEIREPENWSHKCDTILTGEYWIEQRAMLTASQIRGEETLKTVDALNDVVISGSVVGRMIQMDTYIDSDWATTYHADALVIASATGSTAYALACGGPILPPELTNILIVPAAPHLSMSRPIVLAAGATVDVVASSQNRGEVILSADGATVCALEQDDRVRISVSDLTSRFVRTRGRNYFYRSILDRMEPRIQRTEPDEKNGTSIT